MPGLKRKPAKPKVTRAELAELKSKLGAQLEQVYTETMKFCSGRPPP